MPEPTDELGEERVQRLVADIVRRVRTDLPGWTDDEPGDPGVTVLELFAFLAETLLFRAGAIPEATQTHLRATIERLGRMLETGPGVFVAVDGRPWRQTPDFSEASSEDLVYRVEPDGEGGCAVCFGDGVQGQRPPDGSSVSVTYRDGAGADVRFASRWPFEPSASLGIELRGGAIRFLRKRPSGDHPIRRVRYFSGQLLGADDFLEEQTYFRDKVARHNRHLHGAGIVDGLEVTISTGGLRIGAGYALDASGNEIVIPAPRNIPLPQAGDHGFVVLRYTEREVAPVPSGEGMQASRVEEGCDISTEQVPDESGITVARIVKNEDGWAVDPEYVPQRLRGAGD